MITTTLNRIRAHSPCKDLWEKLLSGLGKTKADDEPLPFSKILEINGLDDALWCCRVERQYAKEWRLFAVTCARRVQHLNPDLRVKSAIDVAERHANGEATDEELKVAGAAGAALVAAGAASWAAAGAASWAAARAAAWDAAWAAAGAASWAAARAAARDAAWAATWAAAWDAARDAEREWQTKQFLRVVTGTEARKESE